MRRSVYLVYGLVCYAIFFATFVYAIAWLGDLGPRTVDTGPAASTGVALAVNLALLGLFAVQHSGMARPRFKRVWSRIVPEPIERPTYVLLSSVAMIALYGLWRPLPGVVWEVESPLAAGALQALFFGGFGLVLYTTFLIDHFELFGVKQVLRHFRGEPTYRSHFVTPSLYRWVRHPLYVGWFAAFWATPTMTVGHLLLAAGVTAYILVAIQLEERDLEGEFGAQYRIYRETTPMLVPGVRRRPASEATANAR
jgi:protein-S-isoprenylcysteine O-methyltransferase Ste14